MITHYLSLEGQVGVLDGYGSARVGLDIGPSRSLDLTIEDSW